jgi:anti-sigma B factor antagonist
MSIREPDHRSQAPGGAGLVPDLLSVDVLRRDGQVVVVLAGELDIATGARVKEALDELTQARAGRLVVDLSRLSFLDSTGLAMFIALEKCCRENGGPELEIRPGPPAVQRLFELVGAAGRLPFSLDGGASTSG